jgi:hypothetical protein
VDITVLTHQIHQEKKNTSIDHNIKLFLFEIICP